MITCEMILTQTSFIWTLVQTGHVIILTVIFINFKFLIIQCFLIVFLRTLNFSGSFDSLTELLTLFILFNPSFTLVVTPTAPL